MNSLPEVDIVNDTIQHYRLALRMLWNCCFWPYPELRTWDSVRSLTGLKAPLLKALVADPLGIDLAGGLFGGRFGLTGAAGSDWLPSIQVNVSRPSQIEYGCVWQLVHGPFRWADLDLRLVDMYDLSPLDLMDLRYYLVLIRRFSGNQDLVNQHALVEVEYCRVLLRGCHDETSVTQD